MPCCAFAAFIVGQLLLGLHSVRRFFGYASEEIPDNPATEWTLHGGNATASPPAIRIGRKTLALAVAIEFAIVTGAGYGLFHHFTHHHHHSAIASIAADG